MVWEGCSAGLGELPWGKAPSPQFLSSLENSIMFPLNLFCSSKAAEAQGLGLHEASTSEATPSLMATACREGQERFATVCQDSGHQPQFPCLSLPQFPHLESKGGNAGGHTWGWLARPQLRCSTPGLTVTYLPVTELSAPLI